MILLVEKLCLKILWIIIRNKKSQNMSSENNCNSMILFKCSITIEIFITQKEKELLTGIFTFMRTFEIHIKNYILKRTNYCSIKVIKINKIFLILNDLFNV